jgi:hypothetical protein
MRNQNNTFNNTVTCVPIARQRLSKNIPAQAYTSNNRTSIARQLVIKHASLTIEAVFPVWSVQCDYKEVFSSKEQKLSRI